MGPSRYSHKGFSSQVQGLVMSLQVSPYIFVVAQWTGFQKSPLQHDVVQKAHWSREEKK